MNIKKINVFASFVFLFINALPITALACQPTLPLVSQLDKFNSAPLAFIGVVKKVSDTITVFHVEKALKGRVNSNVNIEIPSLSPNTCTISFSIGQRWLYAGGHTNDASVLLGTDKTVYKSNTCESGCGKTEQCMSFTEKTACGPAATCVSVDKVCLPKFE